MMDLGMFAHYLGDMLICVETDTCKGCAFWDGRCGKPIASYGRGVARTAKDASKTFRGIASAMAEQWEYFILNRIK